MDIYKKIDNSCPFITVGSNYIFNFTSNWKGNLQTLEIDPFSVLQNDDGYITSKELQEVLNQMGVAVTGKWNVPIYFVYFFPKTRQ